MDGVPDAARPDSNWLPKDPFHFVRCHAEAHAADGLSAEIRRLPPARAQ